MEGEGRSPTARPTAWVVLAAIGLLVAAGATAWALTTRSDLNEAEATIDRQAEVLSAERQRAERLESARRDSRLGDGARAYQEVRERLTMAMPETPFELDQRIFHEADELRDARRIVERGSPEITKTEALAEASGEKGDLSAACARGLVEALGLLFEGASEQAGKRALVSQLQHIAPPCETAVPVP